MNVTQYILDKLLPPPPLHSSETLQGVPLIGRDTEFWLVNSFHTGTIHTAPAPLLLVRKTLHAHPEFLAFKTKWESEISICGEAPVLPTNTTARTAFAAFRQAYSTADSYYFSRLPKGREWLLHMARVAREQGNVKKIHELGRQLEKLVESYMKEDRDALDNKGKMLENAMEKFFKDEKDAVDDASSVCMDL